MDNKTSKEAWISLCIFSLGLRLYVFVINKTYLSPSTTANRGTHTSTNTLTPHRSLWVFLYMLLCRRGKCSLWALTMICSPSSISCFMGKWEQRDLLSTTLLFLLLKTCLLVFSYCKIPVLSFLYLNHPFYFSISLFPYFFLSMIHK